MNCNLLAVILIVIFTMSCSKKFKNEDIYVDKFVYLKEDSTLFTGTLEVVDDASTYHKNFCEGIPCGDWGEREKNKGPFVAKGSYLVVKETLSGEILQLFSKEIILVNSWQEGGDISSDPSHLSILILKDEAFFQSDKIQYDSFIQHIVKLLERSNRIINYNYLEITFVNSVHNWSKEYSIEYKIINGKLLAN